LLKADLEKLDGHPCVLKLDGFLMLPMKMLPHILFIGLFSLAACSPASESLTATVTATVSPPPTATEITILPTPSSPGDSITWDTLQVTMDQLEVTQDYITEFDSRRSPSPGQKFLWVHVQLKNVGQIEINIPSTENFSVLYAATELKPTYGHRKGYAEYSALGPLIFPTQTLDGWLRFDIPMIAELSELRFVFLPESSQVGTSFSSPNYPYAEDKPTYVWNCEE
jgi:hypothetical protein